ncbi:MAG: hypothetical protein R2747_01535 [Pyrinomonadaceae bacterium]
MIYRTLLTFLLALFLVGQSLAQTQPAADQKKTDISDELREKSNSLLNALGREADQFYLPENRVAARVVVADLIWDADEKQARQLFQNAVGELDSLIGQMALREITEDEDYMAIYNLSEIRTDLLMKIAARDPAFALSALHTLTRKKNDGTNLFEGDEALELQLASEIVSNDPKQAYEMALKSLDNEINYSVFETLEVIHKKDAELGAKLAREIMERIRKKGNAGPANVRVSNTEANTGANGESEINVYQIKMFFDKVKILNRWAVRNKKPLALSESDFKELLGILGQKYIKQQYLGPYEVSTLMSDLDKHFPAAAQAIRRKMPGGPAALEEMVVGEDFQAEIEDQSSADIVKLIERRPTAQRDALYRKAAEKMYAEGDVLGAKELYGKVKTKPEYDYLEQELETQLPLALAESGDMSRVREILAGLKTPEEKIEILTALAKSILAKGDAKTARGVVEEARSMYSGRMRSRKNLNSILQLSEVLVVLEPEEGFSFLENNISFINDVIAAGILLDEFNDGGSVKSDEVLLSIVEGESYRNMSRGVALIRSLAKADFERTVALADRFSRREARFFARFRIAQALLDPKAEETEKEVRDMYEGEHYEH